MLLEIDTDASNYAMGVMITQSGHLVAFHLENLSEIVRKYLTYEIELYSTVQALKQWRHHLLGKEMAIQYTYHKPL